ncbi:MAG TPA: NAD(P)/FAD-dependent oxidoreductase [Terriglobales bacterium]|nr:NAD(P)/FAD-dependent oxidoreductase [Terriglobales bacterium]
MDSANSRDSLQGRHIAIIGGGITGLTTAFYLLRSGAQVTVLEAGDQVGGLATHFDFGPFAWDKFYHCILTSDSALLGLIDDLGLTPELRWTETKTGFFVDGKLHSMSSAADFLRFPPLSLWEKARLGFGILYAARIRDGRPLEKMLASEWLIRIFGKNNYNKMWGPLLKCKLGACREETSAAFIWTYIARYYSTREKSASQKERIGYVTGGYRTVFSRLIQQIETMGGKIVTSAPVKQVIKSGNKIEITTPQGRMEFDRVVGTIPSRPFAAAAPQLDPEYVRKLAEVKYLGVVCFVLLLKRPLSKYYVLNLTDEDLPFTGVIEMTNLVSREETAGYHLVYLPKYTVPGDPLFDASEEELWKSFRPALQRVIPDLQDSDIERRFLFRERLVQPVPVIGYSDIVPGMRTGIDGLILANSTQIINTNLNNNAMVKIANRAVDLVHEDCCRKPQQNETEQSSADQALEYSRQ